MNDDESDSDFDSIFCDASDNEVDKNMMRSVAAKRAKAKVGVASSLKGGKPKRA